MGKPTNGVWRRAFGALLSPRPAVARENDGVVRSRSTARISMVGGAVLLGFAALAVRGSILMLLPDTRLEAQASRQFEQASQVRGRRGDLLDRNGALLATTVDLRELHVDPAELSEDGRRRLAYILGPPLDTPPDQLLHRLLVPGRRDVRIAKGLSPEQLASLRGRLTGDSELRRSLFTRRDRRRFYPGRHDGASLLGVVSSNGVGLGGLERALDSQLKGEVVRQVRWRDRKGRQITMDERDAAPGNTVTLTIDRGIQHITEEALARAHEATGAAATYAVVVDVPTGEILAMASTPGLNPNDQSNLDIGKLKNRAAMDAIEPGSVFKPFIASAAIDSGTITVTTPLFCENGAWRVGRKTIHDEHHIGDATVGDVIKYSSNICAAKLALMMGPELTLSYLANYGFGRRTGLQLPGETRGLLRSPKGLRTIELATTGYGYGASASAVQLAAAVATLGNGGERMQPRLIKEIRDQHGELVEAYPPEVDRRVVSKEVARQVVDMMVRVTQKGGTGTRAAVPGYLVAGKTGTAKKLVNGAYSARERMGSWIGLIPADKPKLAIVVVVDNPTIGPRFGGWTAGPAFKEIAGRSMRLLGIEPDPVLLAQDAKKHHKQPKAVAIARADDSPPNVAPPELRWSTSGQLLLPDLSGLSMRDALVTLEGSGLAVQIAGSGRVSSQTPGAGAPVASGDSVAVLLR